MEISMFMTLEPSGSIAWKTVVTKHGFVTWNAITQGGSRTSSLSRSAQRVLLVQVHIRSRKTQSLFVFLNACENISERCKKTASVMVAVCWFVIYLWYISAYILISKRYKLPLAQHCFLGSTRYFSRIMTDLIFYPVRMSKYSSAECNQSKGDAVVNLFHSLPIC